jgi:hypothetical protein
VAKGRDSDKLRNKKGAERENEGVYFPGSLEVNSRHRNQCRSVTIYTDKTPEPEGKGYGKSYKLEGSCSVI